TSREHRNACLSCELTCGHLVTQLVEQLGARPDENDASGTAGASEFGVFRKKAVARMDRIDFFRPGQLDDRFDIQIAADRLPRLPYLISLVGVQSMDRKPVLMRIDRDGSYSELMR